MACPPASVQHGDYVIVPFWRCRRQRDLQTLVTRERLLDDDAAVRPALPRGTAPKTVAAADHPRMQAPARVARQDVQSPRDYAAVYPSTGSCHGARYAGASMRVCS